MKISHGDFHVSPAAGLAALLAVAAWAVPAPAQDLDAACEAIAGSSVGAWTEHTIASPNGPLDMRFSLVESRGSTWYEIRSQTPSGASILQLRVPGFPFTPAQIEEAVTKTGASPAVRVPDSVVKQFVASAQSGPLADLRKKCRTAEVIGREEISVPAGTFQTTHLRFPDTGGEVWVSGDVPFGIVRGDVPGQGTTELKAHGNGARSSITEAPLSLSGTGEASSDSGP